MPNPSSPSSSTRAVVTNLVGSILILNSSMIYTTLETCSTIHQKARIIKCHNKLFSLYHFIFVEDTVFVFKLTSILESLTSFYVSNLLWKKEQRRWSQIHLGLLWRCFWRFSVAQSWVVPRKFWRS